MKRTLFGAFLGMFALAWAAILPNFVSAQDPNVSAVEPAQGQPADGSYAGTAWWTDSKWANPSADTQYIWDQKLTGSAILDTVKNAINWLLGILATIALVICLYGWFKMVTSAWDEKKYGDWLKVLKYAAIGLAIIGLSWMIVSVVFWFVGTLSWKNQTKSDWNQTVEASGDGTSLRDWGGDSSAAYVQ
jgi:uncharacterized BrkB/YihY/UPF0761 family membrane protein